MLLPEPELPEPEPELPPPPLLPRPAGAAGADAVRVGHVQPGAGARTLGFSCTVPAAETTIEKPPPRHRAVQLSTALDRDVLLTVDAKLTTASGEGVDERDALVEPLPVADALADAPGDSVLVGDTTLAAAEPEGDTVLAGVPAGVPAGVLVAAAVVEGVPDGPGVTEGVGTGARARLVMGHTGVVPMQPRTRADW